MFTGLNKKSESGIGEHFYRQRVEMKQFMNKKNRFQVPVSICLVAAALAVGTPGCSKGTDGAAKDQAASKPLTVVELGVSKNGSITEKTSLTGHLEAIDKAEVFSRVSGRVESVKVRPGDKVHKGQLIIQLDATVQRTKVDAAKAALAQAEAAQVQAAANYKAALARVDQASESVGITDVSSSLEVQRAKLALSQAEAAQATAQANYNDALLNMHRQQDLFKKDAVSSYAREQAELHESTSMEQLKSAKSAVAAAKESVRLAENAQRQVSILQGDVKTSRAAVDQAAAAVQQAEAGVKAARASLESAVVNLNDMSITAPVSGTVSKRNVEIGQSLGEAGGSSLMSIVDNSVLEMIAPLDEKYRAFVQPGTKLKINTAILPGGTEASVYDVIPVSDPSSHSIKVRLRIPNKSGELVEGAYVEAMLPVRDVSGVVVPRTAVNVSTDEIFVMAYNGSGEEGTLKKYPVTLVLSTANEAVVKGLEPGLKVITSGALDLSDGESVKVKNGNGSQEAGSDDAKQSE